MREIPRKRGLSWSYAARQVTAVLVLIISCVGQKLDVHPGLIRDVLSRGHVSGSISYWSPEPCPAQYMPYVVFPEVRVVDHSGSVRELLQEMFAGDPKMRVTQEPSGIIRMSEAGISTDLLDVKIRHIEFSDYEHQERAAAGANMALLKILLTPEVQDFKRAHNLGLVGFRVPGTLDNFQKHAYGELNDVTVSQALDYVLQTFPGYWAYGNCTSKEGDREVFLHFFENVP